MRKKKNPTADTIIELLGGDQFLARVGRHNVMPFDVLEPETPWPGLQVHVPGSTMQWLAIGLPPNGLYVLHFQRTVERYSVHIWHIRPDSLRGVFETLMTAWGGLPK